MKFYLAGQKAHKPKADLKSLPEFASLSFGQVFDPY